MTVESQLSEHKKNSIVARTNLDNFLTKKIQ